jgi:hypothetical protein
MAQRKKNFTSEAYLDDEYYDYGDQQYDSDEEALRQVAKQKKQEKKAKKKAQGVQDTDINEVLQMLSDKTYFTRD